MSLHNHDLGSCLFRSYITAGYIFPTCLLALKGNTPIVGFGIASTAWVEEYRRERLEKIHLVTGLVMFTVGITMITLVITGVV